MQYVCDAPKGKTWFRIETEGEAVHESRLMGHTVEKYFRRERDKAIQSWRPERPNAIERDIGLETPVQRKITPRRAASAPDPCPRCTRLSRLDKHTPLSRRSALAGSARIVRVSK